MSYFKIGSPAESVGFVYVMSPQESEQQSLTVFERGSSLVRRLLSSIHPPGHSLRPGGEPDG